MNFTTILDFLFLKETGLMLDNRDLLTEVKGFLETPKLEKYVYKLLKEKYIKEIKSIASDPLTTRITSKDKSVLVNPDYTDLRIVPKTDKDKSWLDMKYLDYYSRNIQIKYFFKNNGENFYAKFKRYYEFADERNSLFDSYLMRRSQKFDDFLEKTQKYWSDRRLECDCPKRHFLLFYEFKNYVEDGNILNFINECFIKNKSIDFFKCFHLLISSKKEFEDILGEYVKTLPEKDKKELVLLLYHSHESINSFYFRGNAFKAMLVLSYTFKRFKELFFNRRTLKIEAYKKQAKFIQEFTMYVFNNYNKFINDYKNRFSYFICEQLSEEIDDVLHELMKKIKYLVLQYNIQNEEDLDEEVKKEMRKKLNEYRVSSMNRKNLELSEINFNE